MWVPRILSRHATGTYSWMRPPSRSRRSGRMVAPVSVGVHCRNHLAAYKTLTTWLFVDALPPTASHNDAADVCAVLFGAAGIAVACEAPHRCRRRGGPPTAATSAKPPWLRLDEKLATPEPTTHDLNRRASREWIYITLRDATVSYPRPLTLDAVVDGGWNDRDGN